MSRTSREGRAAWALDWAPMLALVVFSVVAVVGFGVFGLNPTRLQGLWPWVAEFYAVSFAFFAQAQVVLAGVVLLLHLWRRARLQWVAAFVVVYLVSLGSELSGTAFGVPFGPYAYTDLLGAKWLDLVPVLIPLSWFLMAVPAFGLADWLLNRAPGRRGALARAASEAASHRGAFGRILLGSLLLLSWDLSLDPAMSEATRYWVWGHRGPYYGMPLMNLVGWYVTGVALMIVLEWLGARRWLSSVTARWQASYYGANLLLPLGMCAVAGFWGAVVATALVLGGVVVWASLRSRFQTSREVDPGEPVVAGGAERGREVVR